MAVLSIEMYWIGYPVIAAGLFFFFYKPSVLYYMTVFFMPFTATSVFYLSGKAFSGSWVIPSMFLAALCLLRLLVSAIRKRKIEVPLNLRWPLTWLVAFAAVALLSLIMPIIIDGSIEVRDFYTGRHFFVDAPERPLYFRIQFLTQALYFAFGCLFACYVALESRDHERVDRAISIYIYSSCFAALWGLFELIMRKNGWPHPYFLFNQLFHQTAGFTYPDGRIRIASMANEPSILAHQLLTVLPLLFFRVKRWVNFKDQLLIKAYLLTILIGLAISNTTTSQVGVIIFLGLILFSYLRKGMSKFAFSFRWAMVSLLLLGILGVYILYRKINYDFSGTERLGTITYSLSWFFKYPILGLGFGSLSSLDLLALIVGGMGLTGLLLAILLARAIVVNFRNTMPSPYQASMNASLVYSLILLLIVSELSGSIFYTQYPWFILGLTVAASGLAGREQRSNGVVVEKRLGNTE